MSYSDKLRDPRWQKLRLLIMERDKFTCRYCGDDKTTLNIHHVKYHGEPWEAPESELITVCQDCHDFISEYKIDVSIYSLHCEKFSSKNHKGGMLAAICNGKLYGIMKDINGITEYKMIFTETTLKKLIHFVMNTWLIEEKEHLLVDSNLQKTNI